MTQVFAVGNEKGGVGKTTVAVNLAAVLGEEGYRVLLIDSDPTFRATQILGVNPADAPGSLADVYRKELDPQQAVARKVVPGVDLIPSSPELGKVANGLGEGNYREMRLLGALGEYFDECPYDVVLIDTPPAVGWLLTNVLQVVDEVVCVVDMMDDGSVQGVMNTLRHVREMVAVPNIRVPPLRVLRNHVDPRAVAYRAIMGDFDLPGVCQRIGVALMATEIPHTAEFRNAAAGHRTINAVPCKPSHDRLRSAVAAMRLAALELIGTEVAT